VLGRCAQWGRHVSAVAYWHPPALGEQSEILLTDWCQHTIRYHWGLSSAGTEWKRAT
jgi:hypothetical protein